MRALTRILSVVINLHTRRTVYFFSFSRSMATIVGVVVGLVFNWRFIGSRMKFMYLKHAREHKHARAFTLFTSRPLLSIRPKPTAFDVHKTGLNVLMAPREPILGGGLSVAWVRVYWKFCSTGKGKTASKLYLLLLIYLNFSTGDGVKNCINRRLRRIEWQWLRG